MIKLKFNIYSKTLGLFLLLTLLPLIALGTIAYLNARRSMEDNIGYKLEELARLAMERVDQQLTQNSQQIWTWANLEVMQDMLTADADGRINAALVDIKAGNPVYHQISCLNQKGEIIASSEPELVGKLLDKTERPLQGTVHNVHMSRLCRLKNSENIGIEISTPIRAMGNQERVIGTFSAVLDWESMYPMLESTRIEKANEKQLKGAHLMIVNQDGLVIFAPEWERQALDNILKPAIFTQGIPGAVNNSTTGYVIQLDEHTRLSLIGYAHSMGYGNHQGKGWIALALQNVEQAFAPVYRLRNLILAIVILLAIVSIGIAHLFARQLTVPIKGLTLATRRIAQQSAEPKTKLLEHIPVKTTDEIGELTNSFNLMASELAHAKVELEGQNQKLEATNRDLHYIVDEIQKLLENAVNKESFKIRFHNPGLANCWEVKGCNSPKCPSYKAEDQRCWHVAGTLCKGEIQGTFAQKLGNCKKCEVYKRAISTKLYAIGEVFNNLMELLEEKTLEIKNHAQNLEVKVTERTAELEHSNRELKNTQEQLVQSGKMAAIGQLAAGVSHELNNPLGGILGYSQFIMEMEKKTGLENITPEKLKNVFTYIGYIEKESQRCKTIVANLLKFSRSSKADIVPLNINQVLEETFTFTRHQLEMHQVELIKEFTPQLPPVAGNEHQLQQVFTNLIVNAQQAMKDGGKLTVSSAVNNSTLEISFADTGCGIPKKDRDKLFDPFFTTKPVGEGTGLGLSVSYGIIKEHKGNIKVESQVGKGTIFRINLPIKDGNIIITPKGGGSHDGDRHK